MIDGFGADCHSALVGELISCLAPESILWAKPSVAKSTETYKNVAIIEYINVAGKRNF